MRDFERAGARLRALSLDARIVYSSFLLFTVVAFVVTMLLGADLFGWSAERSREHYAGHAGETAGAPAPSSAPPDGPALELPDDALAPAAPEPMPVRKLLEVTHFHLFSVPVYLLILSHLFMLSSFAAAARRAVIVLAAVTSAVHLAAPWMARADWPGARATLAASGALMLLSYLVMTLVPLWDMWRPRSSTPTGGSAPNATARTPPRDTERKGSSS